MTETRGRVESISAVTLATIDMGRAVAFYDALGLDRLYGGADEPFTSYRIGAGFLNLQLDPAYVAARSVWGRLVLWVDEVDTMYERCRAAGYDPLMAPSNAPWGERYFHIRDPDGHEVSLARPLDPPGTRSNP